jgi:hypothetical protein
MSGLFIERYSVFSPMFRTESSLYRTTLGLSVTRGNGPRASVTPISYKPTSGQIAKVVRKTEHLLTRPYLGEEELEEFH